MDVRLMTRSLAVRGVGALLALTAFAGFLAIIQSSGCASTDVGSDLGVVESGCRAPSACYRVGVDCACARADLVSCRTCDPRVEPLGCTCTSDVSYPDLAGGGFATSCVSEANVCVGRQAATCDGVGARCLPTGGSCASSGGAPPNLIGNGLGALEPHCAYTDDVCCPGVLNGDAGTTD